MNYVRQSRFVSWYRVLILTMIGMLFLVPQEAQAEGPALDMARSDVVLVIDNSGSMRKNDPGYLRLAAAKLFIDLADTGDKIGVVIMSGPNATRVLTWRGLETIDRRRSIDELKKVVDSIRTEPMGEYTSMGSALELAYNLLDKTPGGNANQRQFVVLLSDGLPTGDGQRERVDVSVEQFRQRGYWPIYTIALGAEADPEYLKQSVAGPSGGLVSIAATASELLNSYLDVYTAVGDDRFIDRMSVRPNMQMPLVEVRADQQTTQLSVVVVRENSDTHINSLIAPGEADVVQPYYQNTIRRGSEPEYELYTIPSGGQVPLVGSWVINIERPDDAAVNVSVLTRSRLRLRMDSPAPVDKNDDTSIRYHPLGRPLPLVVGAQVAGYPKQQSKDGQRYVYSWVTGMQPEIHEVAPGNGPLMTLTDDGRDYDLRANDGLYSAVYPAFTQPGDYRLRLEIPRHSDQPVSIYKDYDIRVVALPTMTLTLPPDAQTLERNVAFSGLIDLPDWADFQINSVLFTKAFVQRPDGILDQLSIQPAGNGRYLFSYTPAYVGSYRMSIVSEVQGRGSMGTVRYFDYCEATVAAPQAVPVVSVTGAFTKTLTYDNGGVVEVPLTIHSQSAQQETLAISAEGMDGLRVVPEKLLINANEIQQRTLAVYLPSGRPRNGAFSLMISSPEQRVIVEGGRREVPFKASVDILTPLLIASLLLGSASLFWFARRRKKRVHLTQAVRMPRRLL